MAVQLDLFYQFLDFGAIETVVLGYFEVGKPDFRRPLCAINMDVPGFVAFVAPKVKPAIAPTEYSGHWRFPFSLACGIDVSRYHDPASNTTTVCDQDYLEHLRLASLT